MAFSSLQSDFSILPPDEVVGQSFYSRSDLKIRLSLRTVGFYLIVIESRIFAGYFILIRVDPEPHLQTLPRLRWGKSCTGCPSSVSFPMMQRPSEPIITNMLTNIWRVEWRNGIFSNPMKPLYLICFPISCCPSRTSQSYWCWSRKRFDEIEHC